MNVREEIVPDRPISCAYARSSQRKTFLPNVVSRCSPNASCEPTPFTFGSVEIRCISNKGLIIVIMMEVKTKRVAHGIRTRLVIDQPIAQTLKRLEAVGRRVSESSILSHSCCDLMACECLSVYIVVTN